MPMSERRSVANTSHRPYVPLFCRALYAALTPARASPAVCQNVPVLGPLGSCRSRFVQPANVAPRSKEARSLRSLIVALPGESQTQLESKADRPGIGIDEAVV